MSKSPTVPSSSASPERLSHTIVEIIADLEGTSPTKLQPTLHSAVDPEALESLARSMFRSESPSQGRISFTYCGYEVCVHSDGELAVTEA